MTDDAKLLPHVNAPRGGRLLFLNIGLLIAGKTVRGQNQRVTWALDLFAKSERALLLSDELTMAGDEPTRLITMLVPSTASLATLRDPLWLLADTLNQDCVAAVLVDWDYIGPTGTDVRATVLESDLCGPRTSAYGSFNDSYMLIRPRGTLADSLAAPEPYSQGTITFVDGRGSK